MNRENHKQLSLSRLSQLDDLAWQRSPAAGITSRAVRGTILHPTDYSGGSRQAFELACRLALDRGSQLIVMHVAEPVRISSLGMAPVPPLPKGYRGAWESRLRLMRPCDPAVSVEHRLEEGDVAAAILRVAREAQIELIVMSGSERTWLERLLNGSMAAAVAVARKALCPILKLSSPRSAVVAEDKWADSQWGKMPEYGTILHPTDFSVAARHGFEIARSLARVLCSELVVVHVAPIPSLHVKRGYREEIEAALHRLTNSDPTVRMRWVMTAGDPVGGILKLAQESQSDLIVMGTQGRTWPRWPMTQSVAAEIRRLAPCPVATVGLPPDGLLNGQNKPLSTTATSVWTKELDGGTRGPDSRDSSATRLRVGYRSGRLARPRSRRASGGPACSSASRLSGPTASLNPCDVERVDR